MRGYPHAIILPGLTDVTQLTDVRAAYNFTDIVERSAGQAAPQWSGSEDAVPAFNGATPQIKDILDACTVDDIIGDLSAGNVDLLYKAAKSGAIRQGDAELAHLRARLEANAILYWERIRATSRQAAEIDFRFLPIWDGTTDPLVWTGSLALSGTSAVQGRYTMGKVALNGTDLSLVQEWTLENNITPDEVFGDGSPYLLEAGIDEYSPTLVARTRDLSVMATYGGTGTALTSLAAYLKKKKASGINEPDATAAHIKITGSAGTIKAREVSGLKGVAEIFVQLVKPAAGTAPFVVDTASAIT